MASSMRPPSAPKVVASPKGATPKSLVLDFTMERETKGTWRYKEDEAEGGVRPAIGTLYVTKAALAKLGGNVKHLTVTIEAS